MIFFLAALTLFGVVKIMLDLAAVQTKLTDLQNNINSLLALPANPAPVDLQPLGDAVDAMNSQVTAAIAAHP